MTNYDLVREKSKEALAEFLVLRCSDGCPPYRSPIFCTNMSCQDCWEDWLEDEAKSE